MSFSGESNIASWNDKPTVLIIALIASWENPIYIYLPRSVTITSENMTTKASNLPSFQPNKLYIAIIININSHMFQKTYLLDEYNRDREVALVFQKQL